MEVILALSKMLAYLIGTGALGLAIILYFGILIPWSINLFPEPAADIIIFLIHLHPIFHINV